MITKETAIIALRKRFPQEHLILSFSDDPSVTTIPTEWRDFGIKDDLTDSAWYPPGWDVYVNSLPWTHELLRRGLIGTAILYAEHPNLIYIFHDSENYYFYIGKPPLSYLSFLSTDQIQKLPNDLAGFHQSLHDGFTFHPSNTMGPLPLKDQPELIDLYDGSHPPFTNDALGVFHNGAGDYLSIAPGLNSQQAFIWWHEEPEKPEFGLALWAVMDNWISIFLEDTQAMRD